MPVVLKIRRKQWGKGTRNIIGGRPLLCSSEAYYELLKECQWKGLCNPPLLYPGYVMWSWIGYSQSQSQLASWCVSFALALWILILAKASRRWLEIAKIFWNGFGTEISGSGYLESARNFNLNPMVMVPDPKIRLAIFQIRIPKGILTSRFSHLAG